MYMLFTLIWVLYGIAAVMIVMSVWEDINQVRGITPKQITTGQLLIGLGIFLPSGPIGFVIAFACGFLYWMYATIRDWAK